MTKTNTVPRYDVTKENPIGTYCDRGRCFARIHSRSAGGYCQCSRKPQEGSNFCKQHNDQTDERLSGVTMVDLSLIREASQEMALKQLKDRTELQSVMVACGSFGEGGEARISLILKGGMLKLRTSEGMLRISPASTNVIDIEVVNLFSKTRIAKITDLFGDPEYDGEEAFSSISTIENLRNRIEQQSAWLSRIGDMTKDPKIRAAVISALSGKPVPDSEK